MLYVASLDCVHGCSEAENASVIPPNQQVLLFSTVVAWQVDIVLETNTAGLRVGFGSGKALTRSVVPALVGPHWLTVVGSDHIPPSLTTLSSATLPPLLVLPTQKKVMLA